MSRTKENYEIPPNTCLTGVPERGVRKGHKEHKK